MSSKDRTASGRSIAPSSVISHRPRSPGAWRLSTVDHPCNNTSGRVEKRPAEAVAAVGEKIGQAGVGGRP
jgi:hypothetical protein